VSFDDRQTAINNIYIKKVEKKKMFGSDKAAFLKQPLYSRDFPPCRFCE
jgi:branched-chain amino acid transport system substrate-binding protein